LNRLLTQVFAERSARQNPQELLRAFAANKYAQPSTIDPVAYHLLESEILQTARQFGSNCVMLSPAAVFGCCSSLGLVSQNKVVSATRGLEILSDATNMLTLYVADGLRSGRIVRDDEPIHFCTTHRHLRVYRDLGPGMTAHFGLFVQISSGKAQSSYGFECQTMGFHIDVVRAILGAKNVPYQIVLNRRPGYKDGERFFSTIVTNIHTEFPDIPVEVDRTPSTSAYYQGLRAVFQVQSDGRNIELGDLGFTDWTRQLLNRKSERLCISSLAIDRLMQITA